MSIILDMVLIAIVVFICILAYQKGLVLSVFDLISSAVAIVLSCLLYPIISGFLKDTVVLEWIQSPIQEMLLEKSAALGEVSAAELLQQFSLPGVIYDGMLDKIGTVSGDLMVTTGQVSMVVAQFILNIICIILVFVLVKVGLFFAKGFLQTITKLPVLKQVNKVGGIVFGVLEAFMILTILGALFSLFSGTMDSTVLSIVDNSHIARFFYQENLLIFFLSSKI